MVRNLIAITAVFIGTFFLLCSNDNGINNVKMTTVAPKVLWKKGAVAASPDEVDSVRVTITSDELSTNLVTTFAFANGGGTIPGLETGITITIQIEGIDSLGNVAYTGTVGPVVLSGTVQDITIDADQVTPIAPTNLVAQPTAHDKVLLVWQDNSSNEDKFIIQRKLLGDASFIVIDSTLTTTYLNQSLAENTQYYYRICAKNSAGTSITTSYSTATTYVLDNTGPEIVIRSHSEVDTVNERTITIHGTATDTNNIFQFFLNNELLTLNGDRWEKQGYVISGDSVVISLTAYDNSSNRNSTVQSLKIFYDSVFVDTANNAPYFTIARDSLVATIQVGDTYTKTLTAADDDTSDVLTYTVSSGLSLNDTVVTYQPTDSDTGIKYLYALVYDQDSAKDSIAWSITVLDSATPIPNAVPTFITKVIDVIDTLDLGQSYIDTVIATDKEDASLEYQKVTGPSGLTVGASSGIVSWTPSDSGLVNVSVKAVDDSGGEASLAWTIYVADTTSPVIDTTQVRLDSGLVAWYPFNGNADDASGNGNDGTVTGANLTADRHGNNINAYQFNGTTDFISITDDDKFDFTTSYSISTWVKFDTVYNAQITLIKKSQAYLLQTCHESLARANVPSIRSVVFVNGVQNNKQDAEFAFSDIDTSDWCHIVVTYDGTYSNILLNGVLKDRYEKNNGTIAVNTNPIYIGSSDGVPSIVFKGKMDDIRFYNRPLNSSEIDSLYKEGGLDWQNQRIITDPGGLFDVDANTIALWRFDSLGAEDTLYDVSGNEHHGTINGARWTAGKEGKSLTFDGVDDFVAIPYSSDLDLSTNYTIEVWLRKGYWTESRNGAIVNGQGNNTAAHLQDMGISATQDHIGLVTPKSGGWNGITGTADTSNWIYAVGVAENGNKTLLYVNGQLADSVIGDIEDVALDSDFGYSFGLEANGSANSPFLGKIDEIRFSNVVRTKSEIEAVWLASGGTLPDTTSIKLDSGLVAYYPFNGNANDESGNGNDGAVFGSALTSDRHGIAECAYAFDGTDDYISISSQTQNTNFPNGQTITLWVKFDAYPSDGKEHYFIDKGGNGNFYSVFITNLSNVNQVTYRYGTPAISSQGNSFSFTDLNLNQWHLLVFTTNLTTTKTYLDGDLKVNFEKTATIENSSTPLLLGKCNTISSAVANYNGIIDDVRIYNRPLNEGEIDSLYKEGGWSSTNNPYNGTLEVNANAGWVNSGINVQTSTVYRITADGTWKYNNDSTEVTPTGGLHILHSEANSDFLKLGSIIAKVGAGNPFDISTQAGFHSNNTGTGALYLGINDTNLSDNSGTLLCGVYPNSTSIDFTPPDTTSGVLVSGSSLITSVTVSATSDWYSSGITLEATKLYSIAASGLWKYTSAVDLYGPEGTTELLNPGVTVPEIGVGCLIGKIGTGSAFKIGKEAVINASNPGNGILYFRMNDGQTFDNSGSVTVEIAEIN